MIMTSICLVFQNGDDEISSSADEEISSHKGKLTYNIYITMNIFCDKVHETSQSRKKHVIENSSLFCYPIFCI